MAPLKSILKKSTPSSITSTTRPETLFASSKKDKRKIKHAQLMSKITKPASKPRRRRPNKKLVTTLDSLADALPDDDDDNDVKARPDHQKQVNIIQRKSMKSRPGALKRRERVDLGERDRFAKNMAQMNAARKQEVALMTGIGAAPTATTTATVPERTTTTTTTTTTAAKWAALRGFISQTLEQRADVKAAMG